MAIKARRGEELDGIDRRILSALNEDGRLTINALAEKVGLSPSPCWTRVKRLEESGAIEKYVAVLNHRALGLDNVVFIEITLDKHDDKLLDRFGEALTRIPEVVEKARHAVKTEVESLTGYTVQRIDILVEKLIRPEAGSEPAPTDKDN